MRQLFIPIKFIFNLLWIVPIYIIYPRLFHILFQNKHYKLKEDLTTEDLKNIHLDWQQYAQKFQVADDYRAEYQDVLSYFQKFDTIAIFDENKQNPQYKNLKFVFHILDLAKEAITHLDKVTKDNKKLAYYESSKNASLNNLIEHFTKKLTAKNENKISTKQAKMEVRIKRYIAKLKKHDSLFINFYLMLYTIYPISKLDLKKEDEEYIELFQDIFEFYRIGHATQNQIYKSVAIQLYKLYEPYISNIKKDNTTTETELQENISFLINYTFNTVNTH